MTTLSMESGQYSPVQGAVFDLRNFAADMVARGKGSPLCFTRTTEVRRGQVFISSGSLSKLFAQKARQANSSFSDIKIETEEDAAKLTGKMKKGGIGVPFEIEGPVSTDGRVLLWQAKKIKVQGLPVKGLLGMLGKHLSSIMGSGSVEGVVPKGDTLVFEPSKIAHVSGAIARAHLTAQGLSIAFAEQSAKRAQ